MTKIALQLFTVFSVQCVFFLFWLLQTKANVQMASRMGISIQNNQRKVRGVQLSLLNVYSIDMELPI